ncbi:MAG: arylesterase [Gammaproteobacteria bacterium]|nr:arylesterase [Gammaproteobacteria bacterium]
MQSSIFFLLFMFISHVVLFHPASAAITKSADIKILILGDSLSAAYNIAIEQSWPVLFDEQLKTVVADSQVTNASISGETTQGGLARLPELLTHHQPTHLIVELGGNDGLRGFKFKQTQQNLQSIIDMALKQKIKVLLIGVRLPPNLGPVYSQRFQQIFENLAQNINVAFLPRFLEGVAADKPEYMQADGIHPTAVAQPILSNKVFNIFQQHFLN